MHSGDRAARISFVVPAHNEELFLADTLEQLFRSARGVGREFEVIVVDDASTDRTADVARSFGAMVCPVELRQIAAVRNAGAQRASGDVLIFVDADTLLPLATLRSALQMLDSGAIGGGATFEFDGRVPAGIRWATGALLFVMRRLHWAPGCFLFARRDGFEAVGGFDEALFASEELAFSRAMKRQGKFRVVSDPVITSGRKARQAGIHASLLRLIVRFLLGGSKVLRQRDGLDVWYNSPRDARQGH